MASNIVIEFLYETVGNFPRSDMETSKGFQQWEVSEDGVEGIVAK